MRPHLFRPLALLCALGALSLAAGCGGDTPSTPGSIGISLSPTSGSVVQGAGTSAAVSLSRTNFSGDVSLSASGVPTGVTASFSPATLSSSTTTSTLTVTVGAAAAPGTSTITVTASGSGVTSKTATYALTITAAPVASYTMALAPTSASVAQGGSATTTATLTRSNFTGSVALAATGLPTGATATYAQPGTTSSGTVTINTGSAAAGTYNVTITGSATGLTDVTSTFALTVTPAATPTTVVYNFCGAAPVWFGYQSGTTGTWTTVAAGANNTYTFSVTGPSGVAYVSAINGNAATSGYFTSVVFGTPAELQANGTTTCVSGSKTVNGTVAGLTATDQAEVNLARSYTYASVNGPWTITGVPTGSYDLLSTLLGSTNTASKVIIRRAQNPADNATLPVLDFGATEAIPTTPMTLSFTGLAATQPDVFAELESTTGTSSTLSSSTAVAGSTPSAGVPLASLASTDIQTAFAFVSEGNSFRGTIAYYRTPGNRTVAIGPIVSTPTASTVSTTPYARPQLAVASQAAYGGMALVEFAQGGSSDAATDRVVDIFVTSTYFGSVPATWTIAVPNFSAAAGFSNSYALATGVTTNYYFYAYGLNMLSATIADGTNVQFAAYQASMVPASAGSVAPSAMRSGSTSTTNVLTRLRKQQRALPARRQRLTSIR